MKVGEIHCGGKWKSVHIWSFSGPHFPGFGMNTENADQKNSNTNIFIQ